MKRGAVAKAAAPLLRSDSMWTVVGPAYDFRVSSPLGGGLGLSLDDISCSTSFIPFLNSEIPLPIERPISGMRFAPKRKSTIRKIQKSSWGPILNIVAPRCPSVSGAPWRSSRLRPVPRVSAHDDRDVDHFLGSDLLDEMAGTQVVRHDVSRLG